MGAEVGLWTGGAMILIQLTLAIVQWRDPGKIISILFIVLVLFGIVGKLATPLMAQSVPNMPVPPIWQIIVSVAILFVQLVLHFAGLKAFATANVCSSRTCAEPDARG
jgi:hypothetical protein